MLQVDTDHGRIHITCVNSIADCHLSACQLKSGMKLMLPNIKTASF